MLLFAVATPALANSVVDLKLPPGFAISVYADDVPNARQMAWGPEGHLYVGSRRAGNVYEVPPGGSGADSGGARTIAKGLTLPSGVAYHEDTLFIGAVSTIYRIKSPQRLARPERRMTTLTSRLPKDAHHGWKYLGVGPDGNLYVPVGAPCNICERDDPRYATILQMDKASGATTVYAHGVRNTVGFDWHPTSGHLWFSDNGRDMLGDDLPADELNRADKAGLHFGFPYVHQGDLPDPEFGAQAGDRAFVAPAFNVPAHSAAVGVAFYPDRVTARHTAALPDAYRGALFVAEHGSWNRSKKVGYRVAVATIKDGAVVAYEPFLTGFLVGEKNWGRPADVSVGPDGAIYVADDQRGAIYRVAPAAAGMATNPGTGQ